MEELDDMNVVRDCMVYYAQYYAHFFIALILF